MDALDQFEQEVAIHKRMDQARQQMEAFDIEIRQVRAMLHSYNPLYHGSLDSKFRHQEQLFQLDYYTRMYNKNKVEDEKLQTQLHKLAERRRTRLERQKEEWEEAGKSRYTAFIVNSI